jgi:hypothetical protein
MHIAYWSASAIALSAVWVFSTVPVDSDDKRYRYLVTVAYAVVAVLVVGAARRTRSRALVTLGACVIVGASASSILHRDIQDGLAADFPQADAAAQLLRWARSQHLTLGYGDYWDAAPLTWETHEKVHVYPVNDCYTDSVCPTGRPRISSWYLPKRGVRTFFVLDAKLIASAYGGGLTRPLPAFGKPTQIAHIDQFTLYVYPYDIAARFHTAP